MRSLITALALGSTPAAAAILEVPTQYPSIEAAITAAANNDRITLLSGTYDVPTIVLDKSLRIQAVAGEDVTITSTTGVGQIFDLLPGSVNSLDLRDITFDGSGNPDLRLIRANGIPVVQVWDATIQNFNTSGNGAFLDGTDVLAVTIDNTVFQNNTAVDGGVISIRDSDVTTNPGVTLTVRSQSQFIDNTAVGRGGAIYASGATVTLTDVQLSGNDAEYGGAVYADNDPILGNPKLLSLQNTSFTTGSAAELGGGVFASGVNLTLAQVTMAELTAGAGAAVWMEELDRATTLSINGSSLFSMNEATGLGATVEGMSGVGGALRASTTTATLQSTGFDQNLGLDSTAWIDAGTVTLIGVDFTTNAVGGDAGALAVVTEDLGIDGGVYTDNMAEGVGGAIRVEPHVADPALTATVEIADVGFERNTTLGDGGAVWASDASLLVTDSWFYDNAGASGGAIYLDSAELPLIVSDNEFFRNAADAGGAVWASGLTDLASTRNTWCANTATNAGGAVQAAGSGALTVRNDGAADNAADMGGVYRAESFTHADIAFSTFVGNAGTTNGAVLYATDLTMASRIDHVAATGNNGAAFEATGPVADPVDFSAFDMNTADFAGDWTAVTPLHPLVIDDALPLYNNYPAACEALALQPSARVDTPLVDVGPGSLDFDGSLTDVGLSGGPDADPSLYIDADGDGFNGLEDCDDTRADAFPGATDFCNGIDDNCNGELDENPDIVWFADLDDDGYGDPDAQLPYAPTCDQPEPHAAPNNLDCDDTANAINPDADEICDEVDNNCDLVTDVDAIDRPTWYQDLDFDGFGDENVSQLSCTQPPQFVAQGGDCNDILANVYPGAEERCDTLDNDCNGVIDNDGVNAPRWYPDNDLDGYGTGVAVVSCLPPVDHSPYTGDCDDNNPARSPGNDEICDGIDNDCDDEIDVDPVAPTYFPDLDLDGYGDGDATPIGSCDPIAGLVDNGDDCDDGNELINPDAAEACDGVDEDCDGTIDENPTNGTAFFLDSDNDGFGDDDFIINACSLPAIASEVGGDCNDNDEHAFPGNEESCDFIDNDCDGDIDEADAIDAQVWYEDADDDGYGNDDATRLACRAPVRHVAVGDDCDDANPQAFPGRLEVCDGVDNDCNGQIDGNDASDVSYFYEDADGDGFGNPQGELGACSVPEGYVSNDTDCNDNDAEVFPGATEVPGNSIDEDCDGQALPGEPVDTDEDGEPGDCGCQSTSAPASGLLLPLLGALLLRARRR